MFALSSVAWFLVFNFIALLFSPTRFIRPTNLELLSVLNQRHNYQTVDPRQDFSRQPDVTAVILNWSRFKNVLKISSQLCSSALQDTIRTVFIFNNNPQQIYPEDFASTGCLPSKLRIYNSPENILFEARWLACADADTPWCFIQDDDFSISPEIIWTMRAKVAESNEPIYLAPAHEQLLTYFRRIDSPDFSSSFSWLGYGSMLPRSGVQRFLDVMNTLNFSKEERAMADNYFSVLRNVIPETWFDHNQELGGGQPFTVGPAGDDRNNAHILNAANYLQSVVSCKGHDHPRSDPCPSPTYSDSAFIRDTGNTVESLISVHRTPCLGSACLLETSVDVFLGLPSISAATPDQILSVERENWDQLNEGQRDAFLAHPLSHAVDGALDNAFCTHRIAAGSFVSLDMLRSVQIRGTTKLAWVVNHGSERYMKSGLAQVADYHNSWVDVADNVVCEPFTISRSYDSGQLDTSRGTAHQLCTVDVGVGRGRFFRFVFQDPVESTFCLHEVRLITQ